MNVQATQIIPLSIAILGISLVSYSIQKDEVPGETIARMMKLGEELATPNTNHTYLARMAGEWTTSSTVMGMEPSSGSATYNMILEDRYLDGFHDGHFMGVAFESRVTLGYDNYKHKFVASYIDNLGTSIRNAEGLLDQSQTTLSLWGTMDEWMTDEHDKPVMYRYRIINENTFSFEVHDLAIGTQSKVIEVLYTRVISN